MAIPGLPPLGGGGGGGFKFGSRGGKRRTRFAASIVGKEKGIKISRKKGEGLILTGLEVRGVPL